MRTARLAMLAGVLALGGLSALVAMRMGKPGVVVTAKRAFDRRCRGGCTLPLLQVLPNGALPSLIAAGQLSTALGAAITTTRASNKTCTKSDGTLTTLGSNVPCVEAKGVRIEGPGTNYFLNSGAPVTQTITLPGTGLFSGWIAGTGSMALTAGTATVTGLPCTATAASPCANLNATVSGTVVATISGSPTLAQFESGAGPSSYIVTAGTSASRADEKHNAGSVTFPSSNTFSFSGDAIVTQTNLNLGARGMLYDFGNSGSDQVYASIKSDVQCGRYNGTNFTAFSPANVVSDGVTINHFRCSYDGVTFTSCVNNACSGGATTFTFSTTYANATLGSNAVAGDPTMYGWISNFCASGTPTGCR